MMAYLSRYYLFIRFDLTEFLLNLYSVLASLLTNRLRQPLISMISGRARQHPHSSSLFDGHLSSSVVKPRPSRGVDIRRQSLSPSMANPLIPSCIEIIINP